MATSKDFSPYSKTSSESKRKPRHEQCPKTVEIIGKLKEAMGNLKRDIGDEEKFYNTLKDTFNA